jgi:hypothetical protein
MMVERSLKKSSALPVRTENPVRAGAWRIDKPASFGWKVTMLDFPDKERPITLSQPGRLDTEGDSAALPFWSGKPRFFWFVLVSSAILLLGIFPFQLFQILSFGDILRSPG